MSRKVIIDCDPGIDDAFALCLALFDPRLEVVAITAGPGNVSAEQATRNVQAILEQLDPPRLPRVGAASPLETAPAYNSPDLHGEDGLGGYGLVGSQLHHQHPSEKIICDEVRSAPDQVTIICLGPMTNVARAFQRDPMLPTMVDRLILMGGSVNGIGNVTAAAEFNIFYDPMGARDVFRSPITKTLIPLDVTRKVRYNIGLLEQLPPDSSRAGKFLRHIVSYAFRAYHQTLGQESIFLHDVVALCAAVHPELFETREMAGDVETRGELTVGATIFDRRPNAAWRANMEVALEVDAAAVIDWTVRGALEAGRCT